MEALDIQTQGNAVWPGDSVRYEQSEIQLGEAVSPEKTDQPCESGQFGGAIQLPEADPVSLKVKELQENFSYDGFQMVRREAFAHLRDPAVTIRRDSVTFNTACISGLEEAVYVHLMINTEKKMMAVRACDENAKDALRWCIAKPDRRKSRKITSKIFSAMVYDLMGWTGNCRYKILGYKIEHDGEYIYVFDLNETEIFNERPKKKKDAAQEGSSDEDFAVTSAVVAGEAGSAIGETSDTDHPPAGNPPTGQSSEKEAGAPMIDTRTPSYPAAWKDTFGLPVEEHRKTLDINIVDGFNIFEEG